MGDTVALPNGHVEVEQRPGYLYVVEHGALLSVAEVEQYGAALELLAARTRIRRAMIDSRLAVPAERALDVQDAMWRWLVTGRAFDQVACVLGSEMAVVRVNMVARSQRAGVCAFAAVHEAHRWLTGRQRTLSQSFTVPLGGTTTPVPPARGSEPVRREGNATGRFMAQTRVPPPSEPASSERSTERPSSRPFLRASDVAPREPVIGEEPTESGAGRRPRDTAALRAARRITKIDEG